MIKVDVSGKEVLLIDGPEKTEVDDDDEAQLLRDTVALQALADKEPSAEQIAALVRRDVLRLLKRGFATFTLHLQDLEETIEEMQANPPGADGHVLVSIDELKKGLGVMVPIEAVLREMGANMPTNTPELALAAQSYVTLAQQLSGFVSAMAFKVEAYEEAAAEEEAEALAEEGADGEPEDA